MAASILDKKKMLEACIRFDPCFEAICSKSDFNAMYKQLEAKAKVEAEILRREQEIQQLQEQRMQLLDGIIRTENVSRNHVKLMLEVADAFFNATYGETVSDENEQPVADTT